MERDIKTCSAEQAPRDVNFDEKVGHVIEMGDNYTPEEEREVLRKIDRNILPMVTSFCHNL